MVMSNYVITIENIIELSTMKNKFFFY